MYVEASDLRSMLYFSYLLLRIGGLDARPLKWWDGLALIGSLSLLLLCPALFKVDSRYAMRKRPLIKHIFLEVGDR